MNKLLSILLICSIGFLQELEVDGDLKVTGNIVSGNIQSATIDSLLSLIAQLEQRIAQLECQNTGIIPDGYCNCLFHTLDECGVCNGDNTTCQDCAGFPNGDAQQDMCGYCDNDPSNDCVQDCFGEWGGTAEYDICGLCGGDVEDINNCGYALSFDGDNDYVDCGIPDNNFRIYDSNITWFIRFNNIVEQDNYHSIIGQEVGGGDQDKWLVMYSTENEFIVHVYGSNTDNQWITSNPVDLDENRPYSLLINKINTNYYFLLDGGSGFESIGEVSGSTNIPYVNANLLIGRGWEYFNGSIDEIKIWNTNITGVGNFSEYNEFLIGSWNFNEGSGTILNDLSGNENHGTIYGNPEWIQINN